MLSPESIPEQIIAVCRRLRERGHRAYLVGGAVRDHLRLQETGAAAKDFDIATSARPEEVIALFGKRNTVPTGIAHGTVTVLVDRPGGAAGGQREHVEVTTFRGEGAYSDGRRPDKVFFIEDLTLDLMRRDFTINAIAYDPIADQLFDPFHGQDDLRGRVIRAVGDPGARFAEDGLRTMRAVRLAAQLEFEVEPGTLLAIPGALPTFRRVSWERKRDELLKLLGARRPSLGLSLMVTSGLLREVFPELAQVAGAAPLAEGEWTALIDALPEDPILRLIALLLPLAGPAYEREQKLALSRLKLPLRDADRVLALLSAPPIIYDAAWSDAQVRRFLAKTPAGLRADLYLLRRTEHEIRGALDAFESAPGLGELFRRSLEELAKRPPLGLSDLAISGKDVMETLGIPSGRVVGVVLSRLLEEVLDDPERNRRDHLLARVLVLYDQCK